MSPWGIYVHVPWCRIRCPYCAFHIRVDREVDWTLFVDRVLAEADARRADFEGAAHTTYLGGGTPSRMPLVHLARLLRGLRGDATVETTVECNPEDLTPGLLAGLQDLGVDRISLGVQTMASQHARRLGRAHTPADARVAMELLQGSSLQSWSADLMFGLHDQTLEALDNDLAAVLAFEPPHVSLYGLTIEDGTPYARAVQRGSLEPAEDELWREMYGRLVAKLRTAGLERYEVSNFARVGHRAEHNRGYWLGRPYMGLGPAAHGLASDGTRWINVDTEPYLAGEGPTGSSERPEPRERASDVIVAGMRGVDGIDLRDLEATTGHRPAPATVRRLTRAGLLECRGTRTMLAPDGFYVADGVVRALVTALEQI